MPVIYVDNGEHKFGRLIMCHMFCIPFDEMALDQFAKSLGLKPAWKHGKHYDICKSKRALAMGLGAKECTVREAIRMINAHDHMNMSEQEKGDLLETAPPTFHSDLLWGMKSVNKKKGAKKR